MILFFELVILPLNLPSLDVCVHQGVFQLLDLFLLTSQLLPVFFVLLLQLPRFAEEDLAGPLQSFDLLPVLLVRGLGWAGA